MLAELEELQTAALAELAAAVDSEAVESWRIAYLGSKGRLKGMMPQLKTVSKEDKPAVGKRLNEVKVALGAGLRVEEGRGCRLRSYQRTAGRCDPARREPPRGPSTRLEPDH